MEADIYCGGMATLTFNIGSGLMVVVSMTALSTLMPEIKLWFILSWSLGGCWSWSNCCGEEIVVLLLSIFELQIFQRIS
jgi:hypothetical protein